jgi:hypothetical protein
MGEYGEDLIDIAMQQYDNTNKGSLWINDKEGNPKRPDFTGVLNVEGKEFKVSVWKKERETDKQPVMGISIQPKESAGNQQRAVQKPQDMTPQQQAVEMQDIPFDTHF